MDIHWYSVLAGFASTTAMVISVIFYISWQTNRRSYRRTLEKKIEDLVKEDFDERFESIEPMTLEQLNMAVSGQDPEKEYFTFNEYKVHLKNLDWFDLDEHIGFLELGRYESWADKRQLKYTIELAIAEQQSRI